MPGARRVVVPGVGHGVVVADPSGCAQQALLAFLAHHPAGGDCPRVPTGVPAVHAPARRLAGVAVGRDLILLHAARHRGPAPASVRVARRRGPAPARLRATRTLAAAAETLDDVRLLLSPAFSLRAGRCLRGGRWADHPHGLALRGCEAVGGVRLTGRWGRDRLRLRVSGPAASAGRLAIAPGGRVRGVLGGRPVAARLAHRPPRPAAMGGVARVGAHFRAPLVHLP
jgi:hypothetical protein